MTDVELFIAVGSTVTIILVAFIVSFLFINQRRHFTYLKEKETLQTQFQQTLLQAQLEIQEQTLKTISQEIHDNIGQVLSLVKLNLNTIDCDKPKAVSLKVHDSKILITKAIQDLRDLSKTLHTDYITELGLINSVEYELELIKKTGSFIVNFDVIGNRERLDAQKELILFRIVQEALHNVIRHAKATTIDVQILIEHERFTLTIADNGVGFETGLQELHHNKGLGLRNMYNRANLTNTDCKVFSTLGKGTTVVLSTPLPSST